MQAVSCLQKQNGCAQAQPFVFDLNGESRMLFIFFHVEDMKSMRLRV
jgi:hypothetical protein